MAMTNNLQNLIHLCHVTFDRSERAMALLPRVLDTVRTLTCEDFDLGTRMAGMTRRFGWDIQEIYHSDSFHISLIMVPKGSRLPLHNHPEMCVISRALWGHLQVTAFDWAQEYPMSGLARTSLRSVIHGGSDPLVLLPRYCNLHEFLALEDAAFIDIFSPWYDESRVCTYFKPVQEVQMGDETLTQLVATAD